MLLIPTSLKASSIHGLGVFAESFIPKGTLAWRFMPGFDVIVTEEQLAQLPSQNRADLEVYLYESPFFPGGYVLNGDHSRYLNHSDNPNMDNSGVDAYTKVDIYPGEEITCDYRELHSEYESLPYVGKIACTAA